MLPVLGAPVLASPPLPAGPLPVPLPLVPVPLPPVPLSVEVPGPDPFGLPAGLSVPLVFSALSVASCLVIAAEVGGGSAATKFLAACVFSWLVPSDSVLSAAAFIFFFSSPLSACWFGGKTALAAAAALAPPLLLSIFGKS